MRVEVGTYVDERGVETPLRVRFGSHEIEVTESVDQWPSVDYRYFKVKGNDGDVYIIRHNETNGDWELIMYEHRHPEGDPVIMGRMPESICQRRPRPTTKAS